MGTGVMRGFGQFFFGAVRFHDGEELLEFQYKFLMALLAFDVVATVLLLATGNTQAAPIPRLHLIAMTLFTVVSALLWLALRGRKDWFTPVAWVALVIAILEIASALVHVPGDELRILWLFTTVPSVYLLLGRKVGNVFTAIELVALVAGNPYLAAPYSANALATAVVALAFSGVFFHAYTRQVMYLFGRLRDMAMQDMLTGVMNRRAFQASCDRMLHLARRGGRPYAVLFVDLDHFKSINDRWGHAAGDAVLKAVAACLILNLRRSDVVGRVGGEEFCVFLPDTELQGAATLAESLRLAIEALLPWIGEKRLKVTASIGVADGRSDGRSLREIQRAADQAMYRAKAAGRNRVTVFVPDDAVAVTA